MSLRTDSWNWGLDNVDDDDDGNDDDDEGDHHGADATLLKMLMLEFFTLNLECSAVLRSVATTIVDGRSSINSSAGEAQRNTVWPVYNDIKAAHIQNR